MCKNNFPGNIAKCLNVARSENYRSELKRKERALDFFRPSEATAGRRSKSVPFKLVHFVVQILRVASLQSGHRNTHVHAYNARKDLRDQLGYSRSVTITTESHTNTCA